MAPVCPEGSQQVDECQTAACTSVSACCTTVLCEPEPVCTPLCPPGEGQVESCDGFNETCHQVQQCDTFISCEAPLVCGATPSCDEGDDELSSNTCPTGETCYEVEVCALVAYCVDHGQVHGCPDAVPVDGEPCPVQVTCEYPAAEPGCIDLWACVPPLDARAPIPDEALNHWDFIWTTCEGGAGGGSAGGGGAGGAGGAG